MMRNLHIVLHNPWGVGTHYGDYQVKAILNFRMYLFDCLNLTSRVSSDNTLRSQSSKLLFFKELREYDVKKDMGPNKVARGCRAGKMDTEVESWPRKWLFPVHINR